MTASLSIQMTFKNTVKWIKIADHKNIFNIIPLKIQKHRKLIIALFRVTCIGANCKERLQEQ